MPYQMTHLVRSTAIVAALCWQMPAFAQQAAPAPAAPAVAAPPIAQTLPLPYGQDINLESATVAMNAAVAHARSKGWNVTIVVVDTAGQVVTLNRFDNAHKASAAFATAKANSAAMTKRSTKLFSDQLASGRNAILGFVDLHVHAAEGGEVIVQNGRIVGAIGAAGVTQEQDREIALIGVAAVANR
jgi:glc operon protein GlcG